MFDLEEDPNQTRNLLGPKYIDENRYNMYKEMREKITDYAASSIADPIGTRDGNGYALCVPRDSKDHEKCFWTPGWCDHNGYP